MILRRRINIFLALALALNALLWTGSRHMRAWWAGVPPVPSQNGAVALTLGDREFAFRTGALGLQNLGDNGGRIVPLKDYDYGKIGAWLWMLHGLNPASEHLPVTAAYYYGAERTPENVAVIVDYLSVIGQNPAGEKFRWLADAAFLARHRMNDLDRALDIAYTLARMEPAHRPLPVWARQLPALILEAKGEKDAARRLMEGILADAEHLPPQEINFMAGWLAEKTGMDKAEIRALLKNKHGK